MQVRDLNPHPPSSNGGSPKQGPGKWSGTIQPSGEWEGDYKSTDWRLSGPEQASIKHGQTRYAAPQHWIHQKVLWSALLHLFVLPSNLREGLQISPCPSVSASGPLVAMVFPIVSEGTRSSDVWHWTSPCSQFVFLSSPFPCTSLPHVFVTVYSFCGTNSICQTMISVYLFIY